MNKYQKANMEEELRRMWRMVDNYRAKRDEANEIGDCEKARHLDACATKTIAKIDGVKCALCVLGYMVIWKDERQQIVPIG